MAKKNDSIWWKKGKLTLVLAAFIVLTFFITRDLIPDGAPPFSLINLFYSLVALALFYCLDCVFEIDFKRGHYGLVILMDLLSFIFGPTYFYVYMHYDKVLHFFQPMIISSMIFYAMRNLKIDTKWKLVFTFFIVSATTGLFEILEFGIDSFLNYNLQGVFLQSLQNSTKISLVMDPLTDTHMDMIFGNLGALTYIFYKSLFPRKKK